MPEQTANDNTGLLLGSSQMNAIEKRATWSLSVIIASRMMGLFMVLPVFSVLGASLEGATPFLIGVAMGAYGLTQAFFQIPLGRLSDRLGRKPIILFGLCIFCIGSLVAAFSDNIVGVIIGRLLQGCGAIASAMMALAADLSRDEQRTKVMAVIGMSIGTAFMLSMFLGPWIAEMGGLKAIFLVTATLSMIGILILQFVIPQSKQTVEQRDAIAAKGQIAQLLKHPQLWRMNVGIFTLHFLLTAFFIGFPMAQADRAWSFIELGWLYFYVMLLSVILMIPLIILAEKRWWHRHVMSGAMACLGILLLVISGYQGDYWGIVILLGGFFACFNAMEALFPSLVSRIAPASSKGAALGAYATCQFLGAALGSAMAGGLIQVYGTQIVFVISAILAVLWALIGLGLGAPPRFTAYTLTVPQLAKEHFSSVHQEIQMMEGVAEAVALPEAGTIYLKIDKRVFDANRLQRFKDDTFLK